jgi:hypothetical protein
MMYLLYSLSYEEACVIDAALKRKDFENIICKILAENNKNIIRSSTAEYLTFIAATGEGGVEAIYADENIWLSQKMMGTLYNVNVRTVNEHLKKIFNDNEL